MLGKDSAMENTGIRAGQCSTMGAGGPLKQIFQGRLIRQGNPVESMRSEFLPSKSGDSMPGLTGNSPCIKLKQLYLTLDR